MDGMFHTTSTADVIEFMADPAADFILFVGAKEGVARLKNLPPFYQMHDGEERPHRLRFGTYNGKPTLVTKGYATEQEKERKRKLSSRALRLRLTQQRMNRWMNEVWA